MDNRIDRFWQLLESNFPLGGPRRHLMSLLGENSVESLEIIGVLTFGRISDTYPCPHPGGDSCPRQVTAMKDGSYHAVCGNEPPQCEDLVLSQRDVEYLRLDPRVLCEAVAKALQVRMRFEEFVGFHAVYRIGTFIPDPGIHHGVFNVVRCSKGDYAEALDALRSRWEYEGFAVLVPTNRFLSSDTSRQMATLGIPLLPLDDAIGIVDNRLTALIDPLYYFRGIGQRRFGATRTSSLIMARALVCNKQGHYRWHDLDEQGYQDILAASGDYLVFADERSKTVVKGSGNKRKTKHNVKTAYFRMMHAAVTKTAGYFDPEIDGPDEDQVSGKQIFQRARAVFDLKHPGENVWTLFKSARVDNHAVYHLSPDDRVTFAFIFLPTS